MIRGDVRWYRFRPPDKRRPVLVLTRDSAREYLQEVTVAPITTRIRSAPSEVLLGPDDGMPEECAINLYHLQTVPKNSIGRVIAHLGPARMAEVKTALLFALGFED
jgi:mRNA interferase MazF